MAGVTRGDGVSTLWIIDAAGINAAPQASGDRLSFPAWSPDGRIACLVRTDGHQRLHLPCSAPEPLFDDQEAYGRIAFSPDGEWVIYGVPGEGGFLDLWMRRVSGGRRTRLSGFARDALFTFGGRRRRGGLQEPGLPGVPRDGPGRRRTPRAADRVPVGDPDLEPGTAAKSPSPSGVGGT